jgi:hypothetical protein
MRRLSGILLGFVLVGSSLTAQTSATRTPAKGSPGSATIEGDVYLLMASGLIASGDVTKAAANTVRLLRVTDSLPAVNAARCGPQFVPPSARGTRAPDRLDRAEDELLATMRQSGDTTGEWYKTEMRLRQRRAESVARFQTRRAALQALLMRHVVAEAGTGMNAHYRFAGVRPGPYVLWAETRIGDNPHQWWAPVTVNAGDAITKDLDNSVEADGHLYCGVL